MYSCPKGHNSTEADFCSECGAKIMGLGVAELVTRIPSVAQGSTTPCPDCNTPHEADSGNFCEICGYSFLTGVGGGSPFPVEVPRSSTAPTAPTNIPSAPTIATISKLCEWQALISIDPSLASPDSPIAPTQGLITIVLASSTNLIGRMSQARGIHPEIPLDFDDAVSSRHGILTVCPDGTLVLRDIGSANGTMVNGKEIAIMVDVPIRSGDEITLGHWTRIKLLGN